MKQRTLDQNPRRCQAQQPGTGWQCGDYAGHEGSHTALIASDLMPKPVRLTRSRAKGSKLTSPNGLPVVCVTRGTKWGNPIKLQLQKEKGRLLSVAAADAKIKERRQALEMFRNMLTGSPLEPWASMRAALPELRRKNLACWCQQGDECHADILLEAANS